MEKDASVAKIIFCGHIVLSIKFIHSFKVIWIKFGSKYFRLLLLDNK